MFKLGWRSGCKARAEVQAKGLAVVSVVPACVSDLGPWPRPPHTCPLQREQPGCHVIGHVITWDVSLVTGESTGEGGDVQRRRLSC